MKRLGAAAVAALIFTFPGQGMAATLQPLDADGLNLRAGPALTQPIVGALPAGESAMVQGQEGDWIRVKTASGVEAWVSQAYSRVSYTDEEAFAVVDTDILNVRGEPSQGGPVLTRVKQGEQVRLLETQPDWWCIRLADGTEGWVSAAYMVRGSTGSAPAPATTAPTPPAEAAAEADPPADTAAAVPARPTVPVPPVEPFDQTGADPSPVGQSPVDQPTTGQPTTGQPTTVAPYVPVLAPAPAEPTLPLGSKEVWVRSAGSLYSGRNAELYGRVDTVQVGERLTYLGAAEGWLQVTTPRGKRGWLPGSKAVVKEGSLLYELDEGRWAMGYAQQADPAAPQAQTDLRAVTPSDGLRLRESAGLDGRILDLLPQGEVLEVLAVQSPWLKVRTGSGLTGWVHGEWTAPVVASGGGAPAAGIGDQLRATLLLPSPGVMRFEVVAKQANLGTPAVAGSSVTIPITTGRTETALIPVGMAGASYLSLNPEGISVGVDRLPGMQVVEQGPDRLVLELRPVLEQVTVRTAADRTVYTLQIRGTTEPRAAAEGGTVAVTLPGATAGNLALPPGVQMEKADNGIKLLVSSGLAFALKETAAGYELHLYESGLSGKTILLDPGHGGGDPGAVNQTVGVVEKTVNLEVALRVQQLLAARGAHVMLTRATDRLPAPDEVIQAQSGEDPIRVDLEYRTRLANELGVDSFVSLHHNSGSWSARGTETYYTGDTLNGGRSQELAQLMQQYLPPATQLLNRGAKENDFYVTRNTASPAVLVELAFVSNPEEGAKAREAAFQQKEAEAIVKALEAFYAGRTE